MADSYNPFFDDDEEQEDDIIIDSISKAAETLDNLDEPQEESVEELRDVPKLKSDLSYDVIATKLIKDRLLLTALELHTELTETGRQLSPLRDFFSNPGNFEKQAGEVTSSLHRTSSEQTFDSLDLARYSDDGNTQNEEKCTVLEFELRKAKETIKALRASFTEKAETATSSPVHVPQQAEGANLEPEEGIKPLEKRALNFLVNEYLLNNDYRLTSITFADENEDQDFDDWDDVGLNVPRPPDLFHLYRDYGKHVISPKEMIDIGCGEDTIEEAQPEEAEADIAMAFDQEHLQMEAEIEKLQETVKEANEEKEALIKEMEALKVEFEKLKMEAASAPVSSDLISRKDSGGDAFKEPTLNGHSEEGEAEISQIDESSERVKDEANETENVNGIDDTDVGRTESGDEDERSEDKQAPGTVIKKRKHSPAFHQALLETIMPSRTSGETRLVDEVSHMSNSVDSVVEMLARCLPHITPNVLLAKREELVPLILSTGTLHPDPKERDNLLNLLFNLIKKPDEEQRQVILNGCVAFAKHAGESRAETELLPQCWEQITHKFPERRLLVAQSCGALASYLPPTIVGSLVLSMLQQLLEDKVEEVKIAAVKSLGMVFSLIEDADKYNQGLDLLLKTLHNSSEAVSAAAREVFLPAFASWAQELNRLETSLVTALVKRLELAAMDLQRTTGDSHENESMVELYCTSLQCLIPKLYVSILETAPFTDAALSSEQVEELEATRFPPTPSSQLLDVHTIVGYESKLARLVRAFESYVSQTEWQSWESFTWFTNEFIPRLIEVLGRLEASKAEVTRKLCKLFQFITRTFGPQITDAKIKPKFKAVLTIPHDQVVSMAKSGHCPITKSTLPVYTCGVLVSHDSPENRSELSSFLQESLTLLALSGAATDSIEMAFSELHSSTGYHELLLATLWTCVVHTDPLVRVLTAKLFELLSVGLSEGLISSRVVPALITLSGDSSVPVRVATISAFGTILERTPSKEVVERVFTQFQSFLDDPLNKDELIIIKKTILTMGQVGPASEPKFRDEFILPRLTAIAYGNCNVVEEWKKREVAMALFEAYSALSCCFISAELIQSAMLPGLRCLKRDLDLLSPEHAAVVGSMMRDLENKVYGRERVPSVGATSPPSATPGGQASVTTDGGGSSLKNKLGAQRSRVTGVFARKK
ncbi:hypothetical protein HOLleu_13006 [Holothuria leucospilota]|uniref:LisH domain-containing protein n=1 Tax=Holothuria leucospilota TaxID=206669 RepID=A0A9Q1CBS2_HOLLE|nr:hypothetical protein HOLleu_13006 [Holothuria leucospilota]